MLVSESSAMHQLRRRSAQKPQLDLIADRMPLEHCAHSLSASGFCMTLNDLPFQLWFSHGLKR